MKKIFLLILIIVSINSFGQFPNQQGFGTPTTQTNINGGLKAWHGIINGIYADTTAANADYIDWYKGAQIYAGGHFWIRDSLPMRWSRMARFSEIPDISGKLDIIDTASMLLNYRHWTQGYLKWSDTTTQIATQYDLTQLATPTLQQVTDVGNITTNFLESSGDYISNSDGVKVAALQINHTSSGSMRLTNSAGGTSFLNNNTIPSGVFDFEMPTPSGVSGDTLATLADIRAGGGGGGGTALSAITAALASNTINNGDNDQTWEWDMLGGKTAFSLSANTTAASGNSQQLVSMQLAGANANPNQSTATLVVDNSHTGIGAANYALYLTSQGGASNYAIYSETGINALGGTVKLGTVANDNSETKLLTWNSTDSTVEYRTLASLASAFTEVNTEFTGSTSMSITLSNTPISGKAEMYYLNGVLIAQANVSRTGTGVTFSGFTRESSDIITAKYSY